MRKAHEAVKSNLAVLIKSIIIVLGILVVAGCVRMATDHRTKLFEQTPDHVVTKARDIEKQLSCLTRNIYWEAASEPFEGKVAVAQVTLNRMESGKFPDSICGVVFQKTTMYEKVVCQFSWFCESTYQTKTIHRQMYQESEEVAKMVLLEGFRLNSIKEAIYYHADYVNPRWNKEKITQIGRHIFYKDKPRV